MAPALLIALALLAADGSAGAAAAMAPPLQGGLATAPSDDYGYVGWCYGAVAGYVDLYDTAMPEVERIERAWPTPSTEENIKIVYPGQKANAKEQLKVFRAAMTAAEKASVKPIQAEGTAAIAQGRSVWAGADTLDKARLAQFWMSWTPPAKCEETAKALTEKATLLGQAIKYNAEEAAPAEVTEAPPAPEAAPEEKPLAAADPTQAEPQIIRASTEATAVEEPVVDPTQAEPEMIRASTEPAPVEEPAIDEPIPEDEIEALLNSAAAGDVKIDAAVDIGP
ncbi:MAG TPA: hypothetical protein VF138_09915 [Caulobacteraceae bacterium]